MPRKNRKRSQSEWQLRKAKARKVDDEAKKKREEAQKRQKEERERKEGEKEAAAAEQAKREPINSHLQDRIRSIRRVLGNYHDQVIFTEDDLQRLVSGGGRSDNNTSSDKNNNNNGNDNGTAKTDNRNDSSSSSSNNHNTTVKLEPLLLDDEDHPAFSPYFFDPLYEEALTAHPIDLSKSETWNLATNDYCYLEGRYQSYGYNTFHKFYSICEYNNYYGKGGQDDGDGGDDGDDEEEEEVDPLPNCLRFKDYDHEEAAKEAEAEAEAAAAAAAAAAPRQAQTTTTTTTTMGQQQPKKLILWTPGACAREIVRYLEAHIDLAPRRNMPERQNMPQLQFHNVQPTLRSRTCWTRQPYLSNWNFAYSYSSTDLKGDDYEALVFLVERTGSLPHMMVATTNNLHHSLVVGDDKTYNDDEEEDEDEDDNKRNLVLLKGELEVILMAMENRAQCFPGHTAIPILLFSFMAPQHGRIIHAHIQGFDENNLEKNGEHQVEEKDKTKNKKGKNKTKRNGGDKSNNYTSDLIIRLSQMYSFERAADAPFDLFVRYLCSFPVGDTTRILRGCSP